MERSTGIEYGWRLTFTRREGLECKSAYGLKGNKMLQYTVQDMSCQHCIKAITAAVTEVAPGAKVDIDLERHLVRVDQAGDSEKVAAAIRDAGYTPVPLA